MEDHNAALHRHATRSKRSHTATNQQIVEFLFQETFEPFAGEARRFLEPFPTVNFVMRDRKNDQLLGFARSFIEFLVTLDAAEVVVPSTDQEQCSRSDPIDYLDGLVLESLFNRLPRDINLRWCDVLERLAYEPVCLCAVQRIERIKPLANALHRTSTPVLGNRLKQLLAFAETPSIEQKTFPVPEADLADHRLDAGSTPAA